MHLISTQSLLFFNLPNKTSLSEESKQSAAWWTSPCCISCSHLQLIWVQLVRTAPAPSTQKADTLISSGEPSAASTRCTHIGRLHPISSETFNTQFCCLPPPQTALSLSSPSSTHPLPHSAVLISLYIYCLVSPPLFLCITEKKNTCILLSLINSLNFTVWEGVFIHEVQKSNIVETLPSCGNIAKCILSWK